MRSRAEFASVLLLQALGAAVVVLVATREWQTVTIPRPRPFTDLVLGVTGRTVDSAPTAFGLVALAGVVAVLAATGLARRLIGGLVALAGAAIVFSNISAVAAVSGSRARALVADKHPRVDRATALVAHVTTHPAWGLFSAVGGVLIVSAGVMIAVRGGRWAAMSARYETPVPADPADAERARGRPDTAARGRPDTAARGRADAALWTALERGEDPTTHDPRDDQ